MKPLIILLFSFLISLLVIKIFRKKIDIPLSGRIAMAVMLMFTAIGHFIYTKGMSLMLPELVPFKEELVFFTGIIELLAAIGLLVFPAGKWVAWLLILFFILVLPSNIYAAIKGIDYETGTNKGPGLTYLWFRAPLQVFFIFWVYWVAIRNNNKNYES